MTGLSSEQIQSFTNCFTQDPQGDYALIPQAGTQNTADLQAVLLIVDKSKPQSIFDVLPNDITERFILLSEADMSSFEAVGPAGIGSYFQSFSDATGNLRYYQRPDLSADEQGILLAAMRAFRRDVELFPYYSYDPVSDTWSLKPEYANLAGTTDPAKKKDYDKIVTTMSGCAISAWTALTRTIIYSTDENLPTQDGVLPSGSLEESFAPQGSSSPGPDTSIVLVPYFASNGNTIVKPRYIHSFDSNTDYTPENLMLYPTYFDGKDVKSVVGGTETLDGGGYGWFFGVWTGYYGWNDANLGKEPQTVSGQVTPPPYSLTLTPNILDAQGNLAIQACGRNKTPVPPDAWVGRVSSYSDQTLDDNLNPTYTTYNFAAYIRGDELYPGRNGGDTYYRIPRNSGSSGQGQQLSFIRSSRSVSTDTNGSASIGYFGGSVSSNIGESWQYRGLTDMNGDRFPDLIDFGDSQDGSSSFAITMGTGQGFGQSLTCVSPVRRKVASGEVCKHELRNWSFRWIKPGKHPVDHRRFRQAEELPGHRA